MAVGLHVVDLLPVRAGGLEFSAFTHHSYSRIIARKPRRLPPLFNIIKPFSPTLWIAVAISLITVLILAAAFRKWENRMSISNNIEATVAAQTIFGLFCSQSRGQQIAEMCRCE